MVNSCCDSSVFGNSGKVVVAQVLLFSTLGAVIAGASAQNFPVKPVRLIVPFVPGGDTDFVSRLIAGRLNEALGQQVVVENRPGAGSLIGMEAMLRSPADGYTMALGTISSLAVLPVTKAKMPYDALKDIAPIVLATVVPYVLHVHPSVPAKSVMDLVRLAKAQPGQFTYGTPGIATGVHLTTEYFSTVAGIRLVHVPYKGSAPAMVDLISGNIYAAFTTFSTTRTHLQSGRIRALGIAARTRAKDFPQVPTMSESGFPDFEASTWHGLVTRTGVPAPIVSRLNTEIVRVLQSSDVSTSLTKAGFDVGGGTEADFARFIRAEIEKWRKVASSAKIGLD